MAQTIALKPGREAWLDLVRIMACVMVVMMHATVPPSGETEGGNTLNAIVTYLMSPCNGLFFMVSGALLIKSGAIAYGRFIKKRLNRILPPLISWSLIYIVIKYYSGQYNATETLYAVLMIPFTAQGCGYFWFMYVLIGCYLMIPVWSSWLQNSSRKSLEFILLLWLFTSFVPLIIKAFPFVEEFNSWMYYMSGFMGYFLLGYYINTYSDVCSWRNIMIGAILTIALLVVYLYIAPDLNPKGRLYCYLQPYVITACFSIFCFFQKVFVKIKSTPCLIKISEATFGVYLCQSFILNYIFKFLHISDSLSPMVGFSIRVVVTLLLAFLLVRLISHTPLKRILLA